MKNGQIKLNRQRKLRINNYSQSRSFTVSQSPTQIQFLYNQIIKEEASSGFTSLTLEHSRTFLHFQNPNIRNTYYRKENPRIDESNLIATKINK